MVTLSERVAAARAKAERETYDRLAHLLADARCSELDGLLVTDAEIGMAQLRWLNTGPVEASAAAVKTEVAKLLFLRGLDAHTLDLPVLPAERRRFLAAVGRRSSMAKLARREPYRRYPIVLTVLAQSAVDVLDEVVQLFDQAVSAREESGTNRGRRLWLAGGSGLALSCVSFWGGHRAMKIRLWGTEGECREAAERLMRTPGLVVLSVSEPYADRGNSVLVRVFVEARLDPPPGGSARHGHRRAATPQPT